MEIAYSKTLIVLKAESFQGTLAIFPGIFRELSGIYLEMLKTGTFVFSSFGKHRLNRVVCTAPWLFFRLIGSTWWLWWLSYVYSRQWELLWKTGQSWPSVIVFVSSFKGLRSSYKIVERWWGEINDICTDVLAGFFKCKYLHTYLFPSQR